MIKTYYKHYKSALFFLFLMHFGMQAQPGLVRHINQKNFDTIVKQSGKKKELTVINAEKKKVAIIRLKDNLKDGWQEKFNQQETLVEKSMYKNDQLDGLQIFYDNQGKIREKKEFRWNPETKKSELHGIYESYSQGKKLMQHTYKNNMQNGPFKEWNTNGILVKKGTYQNNQLVGKYEEFTNNGKKRAIRNYIIITSELGKEQSVLHGSYVYYKENGDILSEGMYENGKKTGKWIAFHQQQPHLESIVYYKNDQMFGTYERYHPDGVLSTKGTYYFEFMVNDSLIKNVNDGKKETYHKNGKPQMMEFYKMGKLQGLWQRFYEDGTIQEERNYEDNLESGLKRYYDKNGLKIHEVTMKIIVVDGKKTSVKDGFEYRWINGILTLKSEFKDGVEIGTRETFYDDGKKREVVTLKEGYFHGDYQEFHPNGKLKRFVEYEVSKNEATPRHRIFGWTKDYDTLGNLTYQKFLGLKDQTIVESRYDKNKVIYWQIPDLMELNYFPNGPLLSLKTFSFYNQASVHFYFYKDKKLRKIIFQDPESLTTTMSDFTSDGALAHIYLDNPETNPKPASLLQVQKVKAQWNPDWNENPLFTDFTKNGTYELKYKNGKTFFKGHFTNDLPDGDFVIFDPIQNDTLVYKFYEKGIQKGRFTEKFGGKNIVRTGDFHDNGVLKTEVNFQKNGLPNRTYKNDETGKRWFTEEFHDNGKPKYFRDENTGLSADYDIKGLKVSETVLLDGKPDWKVRRNFHPYSTEVKTEMFYYKNEQDSLYLGYFPNGDLEFKVAYKNGKRNGSYFAYQADRSLKVMGFYENDLAEGEWVQYKDGVAETIFYEKGKAIVKPKTQKCGCSDDRLSKNQIKFAQTVDGLISYQDLKSFIPEYIKPVNDLNYGSIFFRNYQFSNGHQSGFSSLQLLMFKPLSFDIPANQQIRITLNPCETPGYISIMDMTANYQYNNPKETWATFHPKRIAISLLKSPLKSSDTDYEHFTALFDTKSLEFRGDVPIFFHYNDNPNACFTSGKIKEFLRVEINEATPIFFGENVRNFDFYIDDFHQYQTLSKEDFFGLHCTKAKSAFQIIENGKELKFENIESKILAGGLWVAGNMKLKVVQKSEDIYAYQNEKETFEFSLQNLKKEFIKNGFSRIKTVYDEKQNQLTFQFYAE